MNIEYSAPEKVPYRNETVFWWLVLLLLAGQFLKLFFAVPGPDAGGDVPSRWSVARDIAQGSLEVFRSSDYINHHYLRWGGWIIPAGFISVFSDDLLVYYLAAVVPVTIAAVILLALVHKYFGLVAVAIVGIFWMFDPDLNRTTFQILAPSTGLLPLVLLLAVLMQAIEGRLGNFTLAILAAFIFFWLYGAKETNIFFAPGVLAVIWYISGWRFGALFLAVGLGLYLLEWLMLQSMLDSPLTGGRLLSLLLEDGGHLKGMTTNPEYVATYSDRWDAGIISRWYSVSTLHLPIYIPAILCSFAILHTSGLGQSSEPVRKLGIAASMVLLSFAFFTSFFIVSLNPLVLGQVITARYLWIALPLAALVLIFTCQRLAPAWAFGHLRFATATASIAAVAGLAFVFSSDGTSNSTAGKVHRMLTFEVLAQTAPLAAWRALYDEHDPKYSLETCKSDTPNWGELKAGITYVPDKAGGAERRAAYKACLAAMANQ